MTQVLAGAGIAAARDDGDARAARAAAATAAGAARRYRPTGAVLPTTSEPPRRRSPWPWLLGLLAVVIAAGAGYLALPEDPEPAGHEQDGRRRRRRAAAPGPRDAEADRRGPPGGGQEASRARPSRGAPSSAGPGSGLKVARGLDRDDPRLDRQAKVEVPAVKGFTRDQAISTLAGAGLKANPVPVYSAEPANTVTAQDPAAGTRRRHRARLVRINISKGLKPVAVPERRRPDVRPAPRRRSTNAGFIVSRVDIDSPNPKGQVVAQDPVGGTAGRHGLEGHARRSRRGRRSRRSPTSPARTQPTRRRCCRGAGFRSAVVSQSVTDPSQQGLVLSQDPVGGTAEKKDTLVTLTVGRYVAPPPSRPRPRRRPSHRRRRPRHGHAPRQPTTTTAVTAARRASELLEPAASP